MTELHKYISISENIDFSTFQNTNIESILFHTETGEERTKTLNGTIELKRYLIIEKENQTIEFNTENGAIELNLRSLIDLNKLKELTEKKTIYIDITGMSHSTWAWLLKCFLTRKTGEIYAIYTEPMEYKFHENPIEGQIFDLSKKINGIAPLPGYLNLKNFQPSDYIFMPLLGFEGTRLSHIIEDIQPISEQTFPVFGIPGFKHNYPFHTYQGNKNILEREGIWRNMRYEQANCPVSIFTLGERFLQENPDKALRIAIIGTKPHAVGAVLLKLAYSSRIDLVYDHPLRSKNRTQGKQKTIFYNLTLFKSIINID